MEKHTILVLGNKNDNYFFTLRFVDGNCMKLTPVLFPKDYKIPDERLKFTDSGLQYAVYEAEFIVSDGIFECYLAITETE